MSDPRTKAIWIAPKALEQLEAIRVRSGHVEGRDGQGLSATAEWLIRAMVEKYARIDRENAAEAKAAKQRKSVKREEAP